MLGYYAVMAIKEVDIKNKLTKNIKSGVISDTEMLVFKVPIDFYHQTNRKGFEDIQGEFQYEGKFYEMVKQKLESDTLYVYCVDNKAKQSVVSDVSEHTKVHLNNTKAHSDKKQKTPTNLIKEYLTLKFTSFSFNSFTEKEEPVFHFQVNTKPVFTDIISPPPQI